jgi:hypothetical protein
MLVRNWIADRFTIIEWLLGALAVLLPIGAWFSRVELHDLTLYDIFPPLGMVTFGLMWTHYISGAMRRYTNKPSRRSDVYASVSMGIVLALLILHPGLLWLALYLDGFGLPPGSYSQVYAGQLGLVSLGVIALMIFLAYELKRFFGERTWWRWVVRLQLLAMLLIFIHGLGLGGEVGNSWFRFVWVFYGITLVLSTVYSWVWDNGRKGDI